MQHLKAAKGLKMEITNKLWPTQQLLEYLDTAQKGHILINSTQRLILLALLKFADNDTLICYPSIPRIVNLTGLDIRNVQRNIKEMQKMCIIKIQSRKNTEGDPDTNKFEIDLNKIWKEGAYMPIKNHFGRQGVVAHRHQGGGAPPPGWWRTATLTTALTTHVTKKQRYAQKTTKAVSVKKTNGLSPTATKASALLEEFMVKNKTKKH
jgi:Helix-turn-helix domain